MPNACEVTIMVTPNKSSNLTLLLKAIANKKLIATFIPEDVPENERYMFRLKNWGTTNEVEEFIGGVDYNQLDVTDPNETITLSFETDWSPPIGFFQHLEIIGFTIRAYWNEPTEAFCGKLEYGIVTQYDVELPIKAEIRSILDECGGLGCYVDQDVIDIQVGDEVFWTDPDEGHSSGYYRVVEVMSEDGKIDDDTIIRLVNHAGSEAEVFNHELTLPNQDGVLPCGTS